MRRTASKKLPKVSFALALAVAASQALSGLALSGQALGQDAYTQTSPEERACTRDVQKFCKDAVPNHDLVLQCLQAHGAQLRAPCHKILVDNHRL
jgi:hypothetical protein